MAGTCEIEIVDLEGTPNPDRPDRIKWHLKLSSRPPAEWRQCWYELRDDPGAERRLPPKLRGSTLVLRCSKGELAERLPVFRAWVAETNECCRQRRDRGHRTRRERSERRRRSEEIIEEAKRELDL